MTKTFFLRWVGNHWKPLETIGNHWKPLTSRQSRNGTKTLTERYGVGNSPDVLTDVCALVAAGNRHKPLESIYTALPDESQEFELKLEETQRLAVRCS